MTAVPRDSCHALSFGQQTALRARARALCVILGDLRGPESLGFRRSLSITIKTRVGDAWPVEAVLHERPQGMPAVLSSKFRVDEVELRALVRPRDYGETLGKALFTGSIRDGFARSIRGGEPLHVMLSIDAPELRPLIWERLCGPQSNGFQFLGLDQRVAYSRYIPSPVDRETRELRHSDLRALVVIACPEGLSGYGLADFDAEVAATAVRAGMQGIHCDFLGPVAGASGRATIDAICEALTRSDYTILHVVAHGRSKHQFRDELGDDGVKKTVELRETLLFLETPDGRVDVVEKHDILRHFGTLNTALPHLIFFAACESGVDSGEDSLGGLARGLVGELGIPAVIAMSSRVTIATAHAITRAFYTRLQVHGHVDEALVEAGAGLIDRDDALVPALYSRLGPLPLFLPEDDVVQPGAPEPEYTDPDLRNWSLMLQRAFAMRERLTHAGQTTDSIDSEISSLRMRLRKDGDLHAGDILGEGRYLLIAIVGEGMTSSVWKAHDRREDTLVALKTLHPQMLRHDGVVRQFKRGAERMRSLEHPGIVRVLGPAEEEDRRLYFPMELMAGGTLKDLIRHRRLSVDAILPIARTLGAALSYAHARKILHRDVEPSNVLFDADGQPRLSDFDLALDQGKIFDTGLSHAAPAVYVAPECLSPHPDARPATDVYGLAMTILFMYAGVPPVGVLSSPRRFIANLKCPPPVQSALLRAVHYSPRRRFATMEAFLAALDAAEVAWWRRRTVLIAAGAALLLGALLMTCTLALSTPPPPAT